MGNEITRQPTASPAELPDEIRQALDQSADDLRHGRVEDAAAFLERMDARVEAYFARKQARAAGVKG